MHKAKVHFIRSHHFTKFSFQYLLHHIHTIHKNLHSSIAAAVRDIAVAFENQHPNA